MSDDEQQILCPKCGALRRTPIGLTYHLTWFHQMPATEARDIADGIAPVTVADVEMTPEVRQLFNVMPLHEKPSMTQVPDDVCARCADGGPFVRSDFGALLCTACSTGANPTELERRLDDAGQRLEDAAADIAALRARMADVDATLASAAALTESREMIQWRTLKRVADRLLKLDDFTGYKVVREMMSAVRLPGAGK